MMPLAINGSIFKKKPTLPKEGADSLLHPNGKVAYPNPDYVSVDSSDEDKK